MKDRILAAMLFLTVPVFVAHADDAVVLQKNGTVELKRAGSEIWKTAEIGVGLNESDILRTGSGGNAVVLFPDGTRVDLSESSVLTIGGVPKSKERSFVHLLWETVTEKIADTQFLRISLGSVGALRGPGLDDEAAFNDELSEAEKGEMKTALSDIASQNLEPGTARLLTAMLYEWYGQYVDAEKWYLSAIERRPGEPATYAMLAEMYVEIDMISHAQAILANLEELNQVN